MSQGGLFTDYEAVESWVNIGYPIVEVMPNGVFTVSKPPGTDGLVSFGTVCEQMLGEVGLFLKRPGTYLTWDFFIHGSNLLQNTCKLRS